MSDALSTPPAAVQIAGIDNSKRPRQDYANAVAAMDDVAFLREAADRIWFSAWAANNPRSDFHWQCDLTYDEAKRRGKPEIYSQAHALASAR